MQVRTVALNVHTARYVIIFSSLFSWVTGFICLSAYKAEYETVCGIFYTTNYALLTMGIIGLLLGVITSTYCHCCICCETCTSDVHQDLAQVQMPPISSQSREYLPTLPPTYHPIQGSAI